MRKLLAYLLTIVLILTSLPAIAAENIPEETIHQALLEHFGPGPYGPTGVVWDFVAEAHTVLDTKRSGKTLEVYLCADARRITTIGEELYEDQIGSGPFAMIFRRMNGVYRLIEIKEAEDSSEIPTIVSQKAIKNANSKCFEKARHTSLDAQLRTYLNSIEYQGDLKDYHSRYTTDDLISAASNLLLRLLDNEWVIFNTVKEIEEDGIRYVYMTHWTGGEFAPAQRMIDNMRYVESDGARYGTQTFTKTRKADNHVMETITAIATPAELTLTLQDDYGSIVYVFPYETEKIWTYEKPTVTRTGACRMSTVHIDQAIDDRFDPLTGELKTDWVLASEASCSADERMVLYRNESRWRLTFEAHQGDRWQAVWTNDALLSYSNNARTLSYNVTDDTITIQNEPGTPSFAAVLARGADDIWRVETYQDDAEYFGMSRFTDTATLFCDHQADLKMLSLKALNREASTMAFRDMYRAGVDYSFALQDTGLREHIDPSTEPVGIADLRDFYSDFICVLPGIRQTVPVYTAPTTRTLRAAKGKASVSLNGVLGILSKEGSWLRVIYETSQGNHRVGWISTAESSILQEIATFLPDRESSGEEMKLSRKTEVIDDPIDHSGTLCTLKGGTTVTVLEELPDLCYIEASYQGKTVRGYIAK